MVIIYGNLEEDESFRMLADAYKQGAQKTGALIKEIRIGHLFFNPNIQFGRVRQDLEPDLKNALEKIRWANHIVLFSPVYMQSIPSRLKGFFDRLFIPPQGATLIGPKDDNGINAPGNFSGKSARIVSILDEPTWKNWQENKNPTYHAIKKIVFEKCRINPVRTNTIGHLYTTDNNYSRKWLKKLNTFGEKLI